MNKEQIKAILSVRPANKFEKVSYEYLEELSINQATEIIVLQQENKELHNKIEKAIEYLVNPVEKIWEGHSIDEVVKILKGDVDEN